MPDDWTLDDALAAARDGRTVDAPADGGRAHRRTRHAGAARFPVRERARFVSATELAQRTHRVGAFNGVAVGLALGWAIVQTMFGGASSAWRARHADGR